MSEKEVIKSLLSDLIKTINDCYFLYESHKKSSVLESTESKNNIIKYNIYKKVYDMLIKVKSISDIDVVKSSIKNNIVSIVNRQNEMVKLYRSTSDTNESIKYKDEANRLTYKYKVLCDIVSFIDNYVSKYDKNKDLVKEKKETKKKYSDSNVLNIVRMLNSIKDAKIDLYRNGFSIKKRKDLFDLCSKRESIVESVLGYEGINVLGEIESLEDTIYSKLFISEKEYVIDSSGFRKKFDKMIHELSDIIFYGEDSETFKKQDNLKYRDLLEYKVRQYKNLMNSVGINGDDLLARLSVCNLDGNYDKFKSKYKKDKIGSEVVSKVNYFDSLSDINTAIERMMREGEKYIKNNNNLIRVKDSGKTKEDMLIELKNKYSTLFDMMQSRKMEKTM